MTENAPQDPFAELIANIESDFDKALFEKRAVAAISTAQAAGLLYREAVASGVPHDLAQAMTAEYWDSETSQPVTVFEADEDE